MDESLRIALETPRIETRGPLLIAGERHHHDARESVFEEMAAQWQRFGERGFGQVPGQIGDTSFGVYFDMFPPVHGFDLLTGVEVASLTGLPSEFSRLTLPAQRYAVFPHPHHVSKLRNTVYTVWFTWLPGSGYEVANEGADGPDFLERYGAGFDPAAGTGDIELWIPLKG